MTEELIDVLVMVFPNGAHYWTNDNNPEDQRRIIKRWKEALTDKKLKLYEDNGGGAVAVVLKMLEEDYFNIPATNRF